MENFKKGFATTMGVMMGFLVGGIISDWFTGKNKKQESEKNEHRGYMTVGSVPEKTE